MGKNSQKNIAKFEWRDNYYINGVVKCDYRKGIGSNKSRDVTFRFTVTQIYFIFIRKQQTHLEIAAGNFARS